VYAGAQKRLKHENSRGLLKRANKVIIQRTEENNDVKE